MLTAIVDAAHPPIGSILQVRFPRIFLIDLSCFTMSHFHYSSVSQTTSTTAEEHTQNFPALVQEMRRRLMLSTEQFAYRIHETPTLVHSWQYAKRRHSKKAQAQLKKVLLEMGEIGRDLIQDYRL